MGFHRRTLWAPGVRGRRRGLRREAPSGPRGTGTPCVWTLRRVLSALAPKPTRSAVGSPSRSRPPPASVTPPRTPPPPSPPPARRPPRSRPLPAWVTPPGTPMPPFPLSKGPDSVNDFSCVSQRARSYITRPLARRRGKHRRYPSISLLEAATLKIVLLVAGCLAHTKRVERVQTT